jgi:hypothetical protein
LLTASFVIFFADSEKKQGNRLIFWRRCDIMFINKMKETLIAKTHTNSRLAAPSSLDRMSGLGSARLGSARLGSARLGSARLGSARLGSARLGSATYLYSLPLHSGQNLRAAI